MTMFQIPGFSDLSLNDQMKLLQASWTEVGTKKRKFLLKYHIDKRKIVLNTPHNADRFLYVKSFKQNYIGFYQDYHNCWAHLRIVL